MTFRLPKHVQPTEYNILLHPSLSTGKFTGSVEILLNVAESTDHIVLHAHKDLQVTDTKFFKPDGAEIRVNYDSLLISMIFNKNYSSAIHSSRRKIWIYRCGAG